MSLADIIAAQKAAKESKDAGNPTAGVSGGSVVGSSTTPVVGGDKPSAPVRTGVAGLKLGGFKPAPPRVPNAGTKPTEQVVATTIESVSEMTLDDLGDSESEGLEPVKLVNQFTDEIPCTAPERELPADLDESQKSFVVQLNSLYEVVHDPELFGQMVTTIMQEMQEHPDYQDLMADQDVHTMIRGLRESMGLAKIKKAEKSTKTRAGKAPPKTAAMVNSLDELFNEDDF